MDTSRPSSQKRFIEPPQLTEEVISSILKDIKRGSPKKYAAGANGITETQLYYAIRQGITDTNHGETDTRWARLVKSLRTIEQDDIVGCIQDIRQSEKGHKGAEWILEHAYWREFCGDAKIIQLAEEVDELKTEKSKNEA
jgi:hypothetical protein